MWKQPILIKLAYYRPCSSSFLMDGHKIELSKKKQKVLGHNLLIFWRTCVWSVHISLSNGILRNAEKSGLVMTRVRIFFRDKLFIPNSGKNRKLILKVQRNQVSNVKKKKIGRFDIKSICKRYRKEILIATIANLTDYIWRRRSVGKRLSLQ